MRTNFDLPRSGTPFAEDGMSAAIIMSMTAIVSNVVNPIVTFSSRSPVSLKGEKIPMIDKQFMINMG
jgi:hypothetical protein